MWRGLRGQRRHAVDSSLGILGTSMNPYCARCLRRGGMAQRMVSLRRRAPMANSRVPGTNGYQLHRHPHSQAAALHAHAGLPAPCGTSAPLGPLGVEPSRPAAAALRRPVAAAPESSRLSPFSDADLAEANEEELLTGALGTAMLSSNARTVFACPRKDSSTYETEAYLRARDAFFGSSAQYRKYKELGYSWKHSMRLSSGGARPSPRRISTTSSSCQRENHNECSPRPGAVVVRGERARQHRLE